MVSFLAGGKYSDIARNAGDRPLASDSEEEVELPNGIKAGSMVMDVERDETSLEDIDWTWNRTSSGNANITSGIKDLLMSDFHYKSFGTLDSSMELSNPDKATSSILSKDFVFPNTAQTFGTVGTTDPITSLIIPGKILLIKLYYLPKDVSLVLDPRAR